MEKKLPVVYSPIIKSRTPYANLLSIAENHDQYMNWVAENFIQLINIKLNDSNADIIYHLPHDSRFFLIHHVLSAQNHICPFLKVFTAPYNEPSDWNISIKDYIKLMIDRGFYIYMGLDKSKYNHQFEKFTPHEGLIYGYNDLTQSFYMLDYKNAYYDSFEVGYNDLIKAHQEIIAMSNFGNVPAINFFNMGINKIKYIKDLDYSFSLHNIKRYLIDYLTTEKTNSDYSRFYNNSTFSFGITCYQLLIQVWKNYINSGNDAE